jgi:choline-glycine betaine transporter
MYARGSRGVLVGLVALGLFVHPSDQSAVVVTVVAVVLAAVMVLVVMVVAVVKITNNDREQRRQRERKNRENEGEETTKSEHQLRERREKKGIAEKRNGDHNQRGGSTHRNKRDVHGRSPPRSG